MKQPTRPHATGTTNGQPFYEDMRRKARWFAEIRGTRDFAALDRLRDRAVAHVEVMREARLTRLDPGGGRIAKQNALVGIRRGAKISVVDLPGHVREGFISDAVEVGSSKEDLRATLKQKLRRRGHSHLDPRTARMFRYDNERETWALVEASGWNAKHKYVWGKVDRPGIYAAVALPKRREKLRRVALEALARRMVNRGVTSGYFARTSDFADRAMFRDYFVESNRLDERSKSGRSEIDLALKLQRQIVRELGRSWEREPLGGNPQWLVLEEIMFRLDDVRRAIKLDMIAPYRPIFAA
jgi:hypothetical protein